MAFLISNWNVANNIMWYVRLSDEGTGIRAELYLTEADASAQTNLQAFGTSNEYGTCVEITLTTESGADAVELFNADEAWHLAVSGNAGDAVRVFKIKEFVDLEEISHSIYRNSQLISRRAAAEIDAHTHASIIRELSLGVHLPTACAGDIVRITSSRRGVSELGQVHSQVITGRPSSLVTDLSLVSFLELKR